MLFVDCSKQTDYGLGYHHLAWHVSEVFEYCRGSEVAYCGTKLPNSVFGVGAIFTGLRGSGVLLFAIYLLECLGDGELAAYEAHSHTQ